MANNDDLQSPDAVECLFQAVEVACDRHSDFAEKVEAALRAGLAFLAADRDLARLLTVAPYAASEDAARRHQQRLERFGNLLRDAAEGRSDIPAHPVFVEPTIVAGIGWQISRCVLADRTEELEQLLPDLLEFALVFYLDPAEASRIARAAQASSS
jgi:hypothetical protein